MTVSLVFALSILAQGTFILAAAKLGEVTGCRVIWRLIASAMLLISVTLAIAFFHLVLGDGSLSSPRATDLTWLLLEAMVLAGLAVAGPVMVIGRPKGPGWCVDMWKTAGQTNFQTTAMPPQLNQIAGPIPITRRPPGP